MQTSNVRRLYVEKRPGFDTEALSVRREIREQLGVTALQGLRLFQRYDVQGLDDQQWQAAIGGVFAEVNADQYFEESLPEMQAECLAVEYLPGQFDQRADSAEKCLQLLTRRGNAIVLSARVYAFIGALSAADRDKLEAYLINPVDSRRSADQKPQTLTRSWQEPANVPVIQGFTAANSAALGAWRTQWGLAMSDEDLAFCQQYFIGEGRDPSMTEIRVLDTYWSDHCRHTTFLTKLKEIRIAEGGQTNAIRAAIARSLADYRQARTEIYGENSKRPECLMDIALMGMKKLEKAGVLDDLDASEEINACSIRRRIPVTQGAEQREMDCLIMFKNETHNHPTEIEPFGGAATCLGGAIRDPLSGRAYVYQSMRITGSGDPRLPLADTLPGKLPQRRITTGAAQGFSSYGNQIGLQTGHVRELYHPGYVAKRMEIGAVVGAAPADYVRRERPAAGDLVILLGGRTGRDGCGGATGSSKAHDESSLSECGAEVQKGNPPTERAIVRLFRQKEACALIKRCNDFGAGGVSVAVGELAAGLDIDLDAVPKKYAGLDGTELAISESQERMAVVVAAADAPRFIELAAAENLEATVVATVTTRGAGDRLRMTWRGEVIVDLSRDFLDSNGVQAAAEAHILPPEGEGYFAARRFLADGEQRAGQALLDCLGDLNHCSQKGLAERFDGTIGSNNLLQPYGGRTLEGPTEGMAAIIPLPEGETTACTLMGYGFDPELSSWSPYHGAAYAVLDSLAKLAALGGDASRARLTFQEYFERMGQNPTRWGKPLAALLGAYSAQLALGVPAIGGKDSMSGSFGELDVPPTLVSFAIDVADARHVIGNDLTQPGRALFVLRLERDQAGLPHYAQAKENFALLHQAVQQGVVTAARAVGRGGIAEAVAKMTFGNEIGAKIHGDWSTEALFSPDYGSIVIECSADPGQLTAGELVQLLPLGETTAEATLQLARENLSLQVLKDAWRAPLEGVFATCAAPAPAELVPNIAATLALPTIRTHAGPAQPRVLVPVFSGSNCEYDSLRAFRQAGALADTIIIRNRSASDLEDSIAELAAQIDRSQILFLPGGFSMGDEPDGSAKFIASAFRSEAVRKAVTRLLEQRDGLMLGICNGFQALIKLGLLPYGEIRDTLPDDPTLTHNRIGRHIARYVHTRVASTGSPWMDGMAPGQVHSVPVSHGEGRIVASDAWRQSLAEHGQIAFQYCDEAGNAHAHEPHNPNGSAWAIEGLLSKDGRILGKMAHSERQGDFVASNIGGNKQQALFAAGVNYFA